MKFKVEDSSITITNLCVDDGKSLMYVSEIDNGSNINNLESKNYINNADANKSGCGGYNF